MAKLTFVLEKGEEVVVPLEDTAATYTLGRGDDNDVVVDDARVSPHHAALERLADGSLEIRDLDSNAGTFVNGERIKSRRSIRHGDTLAFGPLTAVVDLDTRTRRPGRRGSASAERQHGTQNVRGLRRELSARLAAERQELEGLQQQKSTLQAEVETARSQVRRQAAELARLQEETTVAQTAHHSWQERAGKEMREHTARVDTLHADEQRLALVKDALAEATAHHQRWLDAVAAASAEHEQTTAAVQALLAERAAAKAEMEALATQQQAASAELRQLSQQHAEEQTRLEAVAKQTAAEQERCQRAQELAAAREDQVSLIEKKLAESTARRAEVEAHLQELTGTEERLEQALARTRQADARHTALLGSISLLDKRHADLETTLQEQEARLAAGQSTLKEALAELEDTRATQQRLQSAVQGLEGELQARRAELAAETARLEEAAARRDEIIQQCQELAGTKQELAEATAKLEQTEQRQQAATAAVEAQISRQTALEAALGTLQEQEQAAQARLDTLQGRELELEAVLEQLAAQEHSTRARFEEIRLLMTEAEIEQQALAEAHAQQVAARQQELSGLDAQVLPLKDKREAVDRLYARLAELPENSQEAREVWQEVQRTKAGLKSLIAAAPASPARPAARPERRPAPQAVPDSVIILTPETDELALRSGAAAAVQERTLRSRLSHLRESVQREESRLDFLRQERVRHEIRARNGGPAGDAVRREHDRHLETQIRNDEEKLTALQQHIEHAREEEEKRRVRVTDLEHRLAELHAAIAEAERHHGDLRHQTELAQTELSNRESALQRVSTGQPDAPAKDAA